MSGRERVCLSGLVGGELHAGAFDANALTMEYALTFSDRALTTSAACLSMKICF